MSDILDQFPEASYSLLYASSETEGVDRISIEKAGNCVNLWDLWSPKHHVPYPGPLRSCKFSLCGSARGTIRGQASPQRLLLKEGRLFPFRNQDLEPDVAWERCTGFVDRAPISEAWKGRCCVPAALHVVSRCLHIGESSRCVSSLTDC